ncbi:tryptophan transaminase [Malassezia vespertilionis]|uniref:Aminotransferase class I/classII large domain-containing protein n=1 Tax=Malassezia vespertilionis TaxID=2020962 RepID=A0A2N1JDF0_9BASI|nr:tryptophan transaminase [Malassezia vespertilionis]PKI84591.1 hypothetical protein MVES_001595 [Malassezia vespertilionis]WFD06349.1 tryptophan transaminase [Malassezia vespertilionis]
MAFDPSAYLSRQARGRPINAIRSLMPKENKPGLISLLAGKPNPAGFPFESISMTLKPSAVKACGADGKPLTITLEGDELNRVLQYGSQNIDPALEAQLDPLIATVQGRDRKSGTPDGDFQIAVGSGSQDLLVKTLSAVLDPEDTVLVEAPVYPGVIPELTSCGVQTVHVAVDDEGLSANALRSTLANWKTDSKTKDLKFPKLVYTVPTGGNPAGTTASKQRKQAVLAVAREYGILILEDDPYYYLTFNNLEGDKERTPSYFALEREGGDKYGYGYVVRLESFSKIMSAGMRLGFMMGAPAIVNTVISYIASTSLHASAPPQVMAARLLEHWGVDGFLEHTLNVAQMYKKRRDMFDADAVEFLGAGKTGTQQPLAQWVTPVAGMFFWIKLHLPPTPDAPQGDSFQIISERAVSCGVLAMPGSAFYATPTKTPYVRASFSLVHEDEMGEALRRLRTAVQGAWKDAGFDTIPPM